MKSEILKKFFSEYKGFIVDTDHTPYCADQYCTYLRKACALLNLGEGFLEIIASISEDSVKAALCEYLMANLCKMFENTNDKVMKKQISNYKSAVSMLSEFVSKEDVSEIAAPIVFFLPEVTLPFESIYTQKELFNKFKSRLVTQDRYYYADKKCFPARIINRVFAKNKRRNLYDDLILNTRFLYEANENNFVTLRNIDRLIINTDGFVKIESKGKKYDVYTQIWIESKFVGYELLRVSSVSHISLDHIVSVHSELKSFLETHGEIRKFSDHIVKHRETSRDMTVSDFSKNYFDSFYEELSVDENFLMNEISEFINRLELLIIHKSYNSSKSDIV